MSCEQSNGDANEQEKKNISSAKRVVGDKDPPSHRFEFITTPTMRWSLCLYWVCFTLVFQVARSFRPRYHRHTPELTKTQQRTSRPLSSFAKDDESSFSSAGKILVLGGTGFLGQTVCKRALAEGFQVTSLSRRGLPPVLPADSREDESSSASTSLEIDYRQGDARNKASVTNVLNEGGYTGIVHCIGLLLDEESGLSILNQFASGSGSIPDADSTYDTITRLTAFHAIEAAVDYTLDNGLQNFAFVFTSAAEAGWSEVTGGNLVETFLPDFMKRYLTAKRAVEAKLCDTAPFLRPIIVRPSLIYTMDRPLSFASVGTFFAGNAIGLPFIDRPVTVQALALATVKAIKDEGVSGVLRYPEIEALGKA